MGAPAFLGYGTLFMMFEGKPKGSPEKKRKKTLPHTGNRAALKMNVKNHRVGLAEFRLGPSLTTLHLSPRNMLLMIPSSNTKVFNIQNLKTKCRERSSCFCLWQFTSPPKTPTCGVLFADATRPGGSESILPSRLLELLRALLLASRGKQRRRPVDEPRGAQNPQFVLALASVLVTYV